MKYSLRILAGLLPLLAALSCASPDPADARRDPTLSVVSLNIYHDKADWPKRLPLIVAGLRALQPDVIALQEVLQHERLPNQAQTLADALGMAHVHFVSSDPPGQPRRYGNAILTRHPILVRSERRLRPLDDGRTVAHARIAIDGQAVDIYATHLHHTPEGAAIRRRQMQDLLAHIDDTDEGALKLLLGDFNAVVAADELRPLQTGYIDSYGSRRTDPDAQPANTTLNPTYFAQGRRIDHVFAQRGRFEVLDAGIVLNRPGAEGIWASDHFGMRAILRMLPDHGRQRTR